MPDYSTGKERDFPIALEILKSITGFTIIGYAYLYLLGYLYLFSYFASWGLNINDLGFSILDYATIGINPNLGIFGYAIYMGVTGFFASLKLLDDQSFKKPFNPKDQLFWIILAVLLLMGFFCILLKDAVLAVAAIIPFFTGFGIGAYMRTKKAWIRIGIAGAILISFSLMLVYSATSGTNHAKAYRKYSNDLFGRPAELNEVILFSNELLQGLDIYQTAPNKYEGFFLLTFRQDTYYLVPNIMHSEQFLSQTNELGKEARKLTEEVKELRAKSNQDIEDQYIRKLGDLSNQIKSLIE